MRRASESGVPPTVYEPREGGRGETRCLWIPLDGCEFMRCGERAASVSKLEKGNGHFESESEVRERPERRRYTAEYKLRILRELDACERGQVGAVLRREGLYSSLISAWREQRDEGTLAGLEPKKRGRRAKRRRVAVTVENEQLRKQVAKLESKLKKAELVIEFQKKVASLLEIDLPKMGPNEKNEGSDS